MTKFYVKFQRVFEVEVHADTLDVAQELARHILTQFPEGTCKLLSVIREGVEVEETATGPDDKPRPPFGRPNGGGSPGTPTIRVPELVDQIAKVA